MSFQDLKDNQRVLRALENKRRAISATEIAMTDPILGSSNVVLIAALDELVASGVVIRRYDSPRRCWMYVLAPPRSSAVPA